ncbi:MAG TPA: hypothetical protein VMV69_06720 [Pirellulales bacterium]|nr:hypothetical protein [Pirellulales bacterium]
MPRTDLPRVAARLRSLGLRSLGLRSLGLCSLIALASASWARGADDDEADYEIHEMSLWGLDPTLEQANHLQHYPSAMPGVVETERSRTGQPGRLSPLSLMVFHGQPVKDLELDLRVQNGRFLGHWPAAQSKSGRLRWIELATTAEPVETAKPANVDQKHWFNQARQLDGLHVSHSSRSERFLTYDCELKYTAAVKLAGGPDVYQVTNLTTVPMTDVYIVVPDGDKRRIGHLAALPAGKPQPPTPMPGQPPAPPPAPAGQRAVPGAAPVAPPAPAVKAPQEKKPDAKPAAEKPDAKPAPPAPEEPGLDLVMSAPMADDSAELAAIKESFAEGLLTSGLTAKEVEFFMSMAAKSIFEVNEMVIVYRLPAAVIEERLPLVAYPAPRKTVRVAWMVVRNIDPRIKDEVRRLVAELGADDYAQREKAEKRLAELGRLAVPVLKTVLSSADPEVAYRAERILLSQNEKIDGT